MSGSGSTLRDTLRAVALALPLIGLAAAWAVSHHRGQQGTDWEVPVQGYDPRDLLRGHYIVFQYEWPGLDDDDVPGPGTMLCIEGEAPRIDSVEVVPEGTRCPRPVRAAFGDTLAAGKLYIPQDKARGLEEQLADPALRGIVRLRVRDNGRYTPMDIRFEPRPPAP
jgi:hypothetical protein